MTKDQITHIAREAGFVGMDGDHGALRRFASLVAEQEREKIAQMIEDAPELMDFAKNDKGGCLMCGFTPEIAAQYIRGK